MPEKKLYIGTKLIMAYPMNDNEFREHKGRPTVAEDQAGYCVSYPDGYVSWSPKAVFEASYREVSEAERQLF